MRASPRRGAAVAALLVVAAIAACDAGADRAGASSKVEDQPKAATPSASPVSAPASAAPTGTPAPGAIRFDAASQGKAPEGFSFVQTGGGAPGKWLVELDASAPSPPAVLSQVDPDKTNARYPMAALNEPVARDVRVSVRCKPISGKVDRACGLVARFADAQNYYITRANALEGNVRFYKVEGGKRTQLASADRSVDAGAWHTLVLEARGPRFSVSFDGAEVLTSEDTTFANAGKVGLWTKADSVTAFDDLTVEVLSP